MNDAARRSVIKGTGSALPRTRVSNADLAKRVHKRADPAIPVGIGDRQVPFGNCHRAGIAFNGRDKAGSEVKHRLVLP
jgi:3-oxoacyl-[acyl-carrier-protein] synthase-3